MQTVVISRNEYNKLRNIQMKFDYLYQILTSDMFAPPPVKDVDKITEAFGKTGRYNKKFLNSIKSGLKKSSYFSKR